MEERNLDEERVQLLGMFSKFDRKLTLEIGIVQNVPNQ